MTCNELLRQGIQILQDANIEDAAFDARELLLPISGLSRMDFQLVGNVEAPVDVQRDFLKAIAERAAGRPLQYILGDWDFYGYTFYVGEGVLIPRPETELLVDEALEYMKKSEPLNGAKFACMDLCAGSGCIGISVARQNRNCHMTSLEKSPEAFRFLEKNRALHGLGEDRMTLVQGDLLNGPELREPESVDLILSNPPYIRSADIDALQSEVQVEPHMALDGGEDGLVFYRALAELWLPLLKQNGVIAMEIGEDQGQEVSALFAPLCRTVRVKKDLAGLDRVVVAQK